MQSWICALLPFFLALAFHSGEAIRCYECSSERDFSCGDPFHFNHIGIVDCDRRNGQYSQPGYGAQSVCKKTKQNINGIVVVERSCSYTSGGYGQSACSNQGGYGYTEHCSTCTWDGCNGAAGIAPTYWILTASAIAYAAVKCL